MTSESECERASASVKFVANVATAEVFVYARWEDWRRSPPHVVAEALRWAPSDCIVGHGSVRSLLQMYTLVHVRATKRGRESYDESESLLADVRRMRV